jgi:hypothetical protein
MLKSPCQTRYSSQRISFSVMMRCLCCIPWTLVAAKHASCTYSHIAAALSTRCWLSGCQCSEPHAQAWDTINYTAPLADLSRGIQSLGNLQRLKRFARRAFLEEQNVSVAVAGGSFSAGVGDHESMQGFLGRHVAWLNNSTHDTQKVHFTGGAIRVRDGALAACLCGAGLV